MLGKLDHFANKGMIFTTFYVKIEAKREQRNGAKQMGKKIRILFLAIIILSVAAYPPNKTGAEVNQTLIIAADSVNLREGPGLSYPLITQLNKGDTYTIVKETTDWTEIKQSNGQTGWVANWLIRKKSQTSSKDTQDDSIGSAFSNTENLRVRSGPGTDFQIIGYLKKGEHISVLKKNENWVKISSSFGEGWAAASYLDIKEETQNTAEENYGTGIVNGDNVNVRSAAATSSKILGKLGRGKELKLLSEQDGWYEILFSGQPGWVSSQFIDLQKQSKNSSLHGIVGTVTANGLHIRNAASLNSSIIGTANKGQSYTILAEENNWSKIEYQSGKEGWVSSLYLEKSTSGNSSNSGKAMTESRVTILQDGTNLRNRPSLQADVIKRANEGEQFDITKVENEWYQVKLKNGEMAYIAGWIVSVNGNAPRIEKKGAASYLKNKTIVIDPGHGGEDTGTTGVNGTFEKDLTLRTASLVYDKLKAAGANVILTRNSDEYISLPSRVSTARFQNADAFVSLHYDSNLDRSVRGETGYYYHDYQKSLAKYVFSEINSQTRFKSRGIRFGDFHVIRENPQKATLIELGYLSNPEEEMTLRSRSFQENAATGVYNGLASYFKNK